VLEKKIEELNTHKYVAYEPHPKVRLGECGIGQWHMGTAARALYGASEKKKGLYELNWTAIHEILKNSGSPKYDTLQR